jgi:hypothetical protein
MSPYGDIWACCTLAYEKSMGNVCDHDYDFHKVWNGIKAKEVRSYIHKELCNCPLANQAYSNILLHGQSLLRVIHEIMKTKRIADKGGASHQ